MAGNDVIIVHLDGEYDGWHATMRSPSRVSVQNFIDIQSDNGERRLTALAKLILSVEGWQDEDGNPTSDPKQGPMGALNAACTKWQEASDLPKA